MSSLRRAFAPFLKSADECFKDTPKALLEKGTKIQPEKSRLKFSTQRVSCKKIAKAHKKPSKSPSTSKLKPQANANYKKAKAQSKLKPQASPKNHQK